MNVEKVVDVVVLGGGTAGWMAATALRTHLGRLANVHVVESEEIGIIGVGEATLPHLRNFLEGLGIAESDFLAATDATYKLGIRFDDFAALGSSYFHPFGIFGKEIANVGFHHFWLRGGGGEIGDYSLAVAAARAGKFQIPNPDDPLGSTYGYAYQFDATRFGPFLRDLGLKAGVCRTEGRVVEVERDADSGAIQALLLADGQRVTGDLFVDCSGFRSLLLGDALATSWEDWSQWLPCDRAVAAPCAHRAQAIEPYTSAIAMPAGWRWRIPLQSRVGNGYVYSSAHLSDDQAREALLGALENEPLADPRVLRFRAGRRSSSWVSNVVGIGLASGFLEPLESTSIYLVQVAISRLIELFPLGGFSDEDRHEFNSAMDLEYDRIRDFLILHYHATERTDSDFWNHVRTMQVPDSLQDKMSLWRSTGRAVKYEQGLFLEPSWIAVYMGQGIVPERYDARADIPSADALQQALSGLRTEIDRSVASMPLHRDAFRALA